MSGKYPEVSMNKNTLPPSSDSHSQEPHGNLFSQLATEVPLTRPVDANSLSSPRQSTARSS